MFVNRMFIVEGVCSAYCVHHEKLECPIKVAFSWSKFGNWCNLYAPNPKIAEAKPLELKKEKE